MKVAFVNGAYENIGVEYLSAVLKKYGHHARLFIDPQLFNDESFTFLTLNRSFSDYEYIVDEIEAYGPDVIGFSVFSDFYLWACKLARMIKRKMPQIPIIFGGIHPTSVPEYVIQNEFVDMVCIGEGEYALLELVESLQNGRVDYSIRNIWFKRDGNIIKNPIRLLIDNLDTLPVPDKELFYTCGNNFKIGYFTISGRGCFYSCSYCYNSFLKKLYKDKGDYFRKRTVGNLLDELVLYTGKYSYNYIRFFDDVFTYDRKWLEEFSEQYPKKVGKAFLCYARPEDIDEEIVSLLKRAGCEEVEIGIQTWSEATRQTMLNRFVSNQQIIEAVRLLKEADIAITTDNILGIPGQSEEELVDLIEFHNKNRVSRMHILWLRHYPKTTIIEIAKKYGYLNESDIDRINQATFVSPYTQGGNTYNKRLAKFQTFFVLLPLLPKKLITIIAKKKYYRYLPTVVPFILRIFANIFESSSRFDYIMRKRALFRYLDGLIKYFKTKLNMKKDVRLEKKT